jgi:hypothetical protein
MKTRGEWACLLAVVLLAVPFGTAAQTPIASLSVGSASGLPRTSDVAVPVSLASQGGAEVAGLSFDLTFDSSRLSVAGVSIGSAAASAGKLLSWNLVSANRIRVIIFGVNQTAIPDSSVAVVSFNVPAGAPAGTSALTLSNTVASDSDGKPVVRDTSNGSFRVLSRRLRMPPPQPRPTQRVPPPPRAR